MLGWGVLSLCARAVLRALKSIGRPLLAVMAFFAPFARVCRVMIVAAIRAVVWGLVLVCSAGGWVVFVLVYSFVLTARGTWWLFRPVVRLSVAVGLYVARAHGGCFVSGR
jgi:hypothetical protein